MRDIRLRPVLLIALSLPLTLPFSVPLADAQPQLQERGFKVRHLEQCGEAATLGTRPPYVLRGTIGGIACAPGGDWGTDVYLGVYVYWDEILSYVEAVDERGNARFAVSAPDRPVPHLAFSPPGWRGGDSLFVSESCNDFLGCGLLPAFLVQWNVGGRVGSITNPPYSVGYAAVDPSGDFGNDLFYMSGSASGRGLYRQDAAGDVTLFAAVDGIPRFGPGGPWGTGLYVADQVFAPDGTSTPFPGGFGGDFDWAFGPRFDGDMFVARPGAVKADIYRVKPDGSRTLFATGADGSFASCNGSLWFAGPDGCWVVTPSKGNPPH